MATQCEGKREMLRVMSAPRGASLSPRVRVKEAARRSSSSPPTMHTATEKPPPGSPQGCTLIACPPQGKIDTASPQRDVTTPESPAQPQSRTEPCTTAQYTDLSDGVADQEGTQTPEAETKLSSRQNSLLKIYDVSDDPSDSDLEKYVLKKR